MYAWAWHRLPGPFVVRVVLALIVAAAVVALLFGVVFPWIDDVLGVDGSTIGGVPG